LEHSSHILKLTFSPRVGVSLLPGLSQKIRDAGMELPKPQAQHGSKKSKAKAEDEFKLSDFTRTILDTIMRATQ